MQTLIQDLRYFLRQILNNPGFTVTSVVSLALGIGATTAIFSVIYAALLNPYPYPTADRIVRLTIHSKEVPIDEVLLNGPQVQQVRQLPVIESVLAMDHHALALTGHELPENVNVVNLISNGFNDLGVPPLVGRGLLPSDAIDGQDPQPVVVLGYKFWQKHFLSNPDVLGNTLQLDRKNYQIVGVAMPRFTWYSADVYLPLKLTQNPGPVFTVDLLLKPGVTHDAANAALQPVLGQFARDMPKHFPKQFKVGVEGLNEWVVRSISKTLYLLFGAVAVLLAIGCANVSILLLVRGTARQHELAVRSAVGARRLRVIRQLLTESLVLAGLGALLGVLAAYGILAIIRTLLPRYAFAPEVVVRMNVPVLFFSAGVALATGILFGLWPAVQLSRTHLADVLQTGLRRIAGTVHGRSTHRVLISPQIAFTLLLLTGAGSALEGFLRLLHTPLGYDPHHVLWVGIPLRANSSATWGSRAAYVDQLRAKVAEMPGVTMAAISNNATPPRNGWTERFEILGKPAEEQAIGSINMVSPEYFAVLRIPVLRGRVWNQTENFNGARVAVINRTLAQRFFPNGDAIGHSVKVPDLEERPPELLLAPHMTDSWLQIIGIVDDARNDGLRDPVKPAIFLPYTLSMWRTTQILVRSDVPPSALLHAVRAQLTTVNPEQQTYSGIVEDLDTWLSEQPERQQQLAAWIFGLFAVLALVLAAVGLYSVVSYTVAQRTNEFGIRMALGAQPRDVLRIVFSSTLASIGTGMLAGLLMTLILGTILAKWAEGNSRDPVVLLAGVFVLSVASAIACIIPARHASAVAPMTALRCE
jgi:predicted permease